MEEFKKKGYYPAGGRSQTSSAGSITYINTNSGLSAGNVQDAIDEISSTISKNMTYSTDEKVVGKWVDDSDVYEKTYIIETLIAGTNTIEVISLSNIIDTNGSIQDTSGNIFSLSVHVNDLMIYVYYDKASNTLGVYTPATLTQNFILTIRYLKEI